MNKKSIIQSVKRQEEEKVAFSLKLPASVKEQLHKTAENESISMNSLIVATLQSMLDDDCGKELEKVQTQLKVAEEELRSASKALFDPEEEYHDAIDRFDPDIPHDIAGRIISRKHSRDSINRYFEEKTK